MRFRLCIEPPTATAQLRRFTRNGRTYKPKPVKDAEALFIRELTPFVPKEPIVNPICLTVRWYFPIRGKHRDREWKTTRPDLDNLMKLFKDCMTHLGYWKDDSYVVIEHAEKRYAADPGIEVEVKEIE